MDRIQIEIIIDQKDSHTKVWMMRNSNKSLKYKIYQSKKNTEVSDHI